MDFDEPPEMAAFRTELRGWLDENIPAPWRDPTYWYRQDADRSFEERRAWESAKADAGWAGVDWPTAYGGRGGTVMQRLAYEEETARGAVPDSVNPQINFLGPTLLQFGTEEQRRRFLKPLLRCDEIWCQGFSEPMSGSDLASLTTAGEVRGDEVIVDGHKVWTSFAQRADWIFALVRTDRRAPRHRGLSLLLIDMSSPGITVRAFPHITGRMEFAEVWFDHVSVPRANLVGQLDDGWRVVNALLAHERQYTGFGHYEKYSKQLHRLFELFAREAPTMSDARRAVLRQELTKVYSELAILRLQCHWGMSHLLNDRDRSPLEQQRTSLTKVMASETHQRMGELFTEIGAESALLTDPHLYQDFPDLQYAFFRSRAETISGGSAQVQRNVIGERMLGLPREPRPEHG
jgi:alkylation response protein AidB-like acyl-CoA dehydrogenase